MTGTYLCNYNAPTSELCFAHVLQQDNIVYQVHQTVYKLMILEMFVFGNMCIDIMNTWVDIYIFVYVKECNVNTYAYICIGLGV